MAETPKTEMVLRIKVRNPSHALRESLTEFVAGYVASGVECSMSYREELVEPLPPAGNAARDNCDDK